VRGYESPSEYVRVRCAYLDNLFKSIRDDGYRSNAAAYHEMATGDNKFEDAYANHLDPLVAISRTGEIYWLEGYHRFAIASILELEEIPVYVLCRHEEWQRVRDALSTEPSSSLSSELEGMLIIQTHRTSMCRVVGTRFAPCISHGYRNIPLSW